MKLKRLWSMLLAGALVLAAAGCGTKETADTQAPADTQQAQSSADTQAEAEDAGEAGESGDSQAAGEGGYNVTWEDTAEIVVLYPSMTAIPSGLQAVEDAINEITMEEINTHVTLLMIEVGNYEQQANLMISSNEQLDLMITQPGGPTSFSTMASQHQLMDMGPLLETYAPQALSTVGELINGLKLEGTTYAFPTYKGFAGGLTLFMRTDVLEDLGLLEKAENMTSFSEFEEILEAVKNSEKWNYLAGIVSTDGHGCVLANSGNVVYADKFADCTTNDNLGNTQALVSVADDGTNTVVNTFASDAYRQNYEMVKSWYDKGYVYKDSATTPEMGSALVKSNVAFSYTAACELGGEESADTSCGMPITHVVITEMPITTGSLTKFTWVVPVTAKEPEAAVTFLEMMFTDARVANLFAWGIEGVDYEVGEDGVAHYIEGNENPAYHAVNFLNANKFLVHPWDGDDPNVNEIYMEYMENSEYSPYLGFSVDTAQVSDQVSAITNIIEQYQPQILSGTASEETFQEFLEKLEIAGIDDVVALYQEELDRWLESNGN